MNRASIKISPSQEPVVFALHVKTQPTMLRRISRPSAVLRPIRRSNFQPAQLRTLIAAPKAGDGPLMERRGDRELPKPEPNRLLRTFPIFLIILGASALAFFNYQKSSSSVVTSALYALRVNPKGRELLGDEVYFAHRVPYIWGSIDQLHGKIDIWFRVKGTKASGMMKFKCQRPTRMGFVSFLVLFESSGKQLASLDINSGLTWSILVPNPRVVSANGQR